MASDSTRKKYVSSGSRSSVNRSVIKETRRNVSYMDEILNIQAAWFKGKNPWIVIANPNDNERNKKFIRIRTNEIWGNPKDVRKYDPNFSKGGAS